MRKLSLRRKVKNGKKKEAKVSGGRVGKIKGNVVVFPKKVLAPVNKLLSAKLKKLKRRKRGIEKEDPFADTSRVSDNASPDTDAAEQFGHARVSAIKEQLDKRMVQTRKALARIRVGKYGTCEDCGKMINTDRLVVKPEAAFCIECEKKREG